MLEALSNFVLRKRSLRASSVSRKEPGDAAKMFVTLSQPSSGVRIFTRVFGSASSGPAVVATTSPTFEIFEIPIPVDTEKFTVENSSTLWRDSKVFPAFKVDASVG
ncbi:hypothetical protein D3C85_969980 [compost metagenome]